MTAAMLVWSRSSKPTFHRKLYAYRRGETPNRRWLTVEEVLFAAIRKLWDGDPRDYFGSIPHASF